MQSMLILLKEFFVKHKIPIITFVCGFLIATAIFLSIGNDDNLTELDKEISFKEGEIKVLQSQLKDVKIIAKEYRTKDSINSLKLSQLLKELNQINNGKNDKINNVDNYTDFELQRFFTERYSSRSPQ